MKSRKFLFVILSLSLLIPGCGPRANEYPTPTPLYQGATATPENTPDPENPFVTVSNGKFVLGGKPYYFVGTNFWQGMNMGVDRPNGNRELLWLELDHMQQVGITNLRVMAASEGPNSEPYRMTPALQVSPGEYDESVLDGLDYLIHQMGERGLRAVMVLNNYWQWSGGMGQYVAWAEGTSIPYPGDWSKFMNYVAKFYACDICQTWYRAHIAMIIDHTNPYTGLKYRDDPTIFSWELANEPRRYPQSWIDGTAGYIKSLDPNHMVTTGSEGTPPGENIDFMETHGGANIDYTTIHIWPGNWGWYDPRMPKTYDSAEVQAIMYFQNHARWSAEIGKPMVLEEFGLARDYEPLRDIYNVNAATTHRDRFYTALYAQVFASVTSGGAVCGDNFWAWAGKSLPGSPFIGDPPHETAGWYSVYEMDESTLAIIAAHAAEMKNIRK